MAEALVDTRLLFAFIQQRQATKRCTCVQISNKQNGHKSMRFRRSHFRKYAQMQIEFAMHIHTVQSISIWLVSMQMSNRLCEHRCHIERLWWPFAREAILAHEEHEKQHVHERFQLFVMFDARVLLDWSGSIWQNVGHVKSWDEFHRVECRKHIFELSQIQSHV